MEFNFKHWVQIFEKNRRMFCPPNWNDHYQLTKEEYQTIYKSIQQFQKGESSDGKKLLAAAERQIHHLEDQSYVKAIKLFIKEEQNHARLLGKFMVKQDIPKLQSHWLDNFFRSLRKTYGIQSYVTVLLTAELIAIIYYQALRKATNSPILIAICNQILSDEEKHIRFQSITLHRLWRHRSSFSIYCRNSVRKILMYSTIWIVWRNHYKVLKAGGYSLTHFAKSVLKEYRKSNKIITLGDRIESTMVSVQ
ncbi:ferritin-like domain-containing protein [Risungbinella massiliensis]|uniref:ferritin-like domain-containing protein n=1 Tax=Risungbinella massiliensis TaxID=1329796 RepID=UPI0005CBB60D|nr:ferritin-like domain-containing protein [Risungbinella massiliensis]